MNRARIIRWTAIVTVAAAIIGWSFYLRFRVDEQFAAQVLDAKEEAQRIQTTVILFSAHALPSGLPFANVLESWGIQQVTATSVIQAVQPVFDLRHLRAGNRLEIGRSVLGELRAMRYQIDTDRMLSVTSEENGRFHASVETIPTTTETVGIGGKIQDSLWQGVLDSGEGPELAVRLGEIFGFDLDFYTDPRPGDTFRVVLEKKRYANGQTAAYGRILAAEYDNAGHAYRAILFRDAAGNPAYFGPDGKSLKKAFLHSPLKYAAPVSSHFSTHRFHPILKVYRAHLGTDYAAPVGTPVQAIGSGRVTFAGRKGGAGNLVEIEHTNGYATYYMHLSRILVRSGQRVEQGQRVGAVGMTGLATGPHLDFRISQNGTFRNFETLHLPSSEPISRREMNEFAASRDHWIALMPDLSTLLARGSPPAGAAASPAR